MRTFKLINGNGNEYPLNTIENGYVINPSGLGYGSVTDVLNTGDTIIPTITRINRPVVSGTLILPSYAVYDALITFISVGDLVLGYKPTEADGWRYLKVDAVIGKSEINRMNKLACAFTFNGLSRWMAESITYTGTSSVEISAFPKGSPMKITIVGAVTEPVWTYSHGSTVVATGKQKRTVAAGKSLIIDSRPDSFSTTYDGANDYEHSDINTVRYIRADGLPGSISVSPAPSSLTVEVFPYV